MRVIDETITDFLTTLNLGLEWIGDAGRKLHPRLSWKGWTLVSNREGRESGDLISRTALLSNSDNGIKVENGESN